MQNAAGVRALEIVTKFSHTRPNGSAFSSVLGEYGIAYSRTGENILHATAGAYTPAQIVQTWMGSPGHRANILNPDYNMLGVGFTRANGMDHFVQLFIRQ